MGASDAGIGGASMQSRTTDADLVLVVKVRRLPVQSHSYAMAKGYCRKSLAMGEGVTGAFVAGEGDTGTGRVGAGVLITNGLVGRGVVTPMLGGKVGSGGLVIGTGGLVIGSITGANAGGLVCPGASV